MNYIEIAKEVLEIESRELLLASKSLDDEFVKAVEIIFNCEGKVIITGVGKSGLVGSKIAATLASTGTSSFFIHPTEAMHGDLGMIQRRDTILAISYSGESEELVGILPHLKRFGLKIITMSRSMSSSLAKMGDANLSIEVSKEACPLNAAPTSSTTLTMALGDALAVVLMKRRDFKKSDFASFHPGGMLGKRLFVKAKDIMQKTNLPIVHKETTLKEAIAKMSEGRLGNLFILDKDGRIEAILSDGDLRRALMRDDFSLQKNALDFASKNPLICEDENMLASEILELIEERKVQIIAIVNSKKELIGAIHIHALVEAGIK